jgi:hypothetical protein
MDAHCKIGKIIPKDKKISVISSAKETNEEMKKAISDFRECWDRLEQVTGYFVVAWDKEGGFYRAFNIMADSAIPMTLLPSWVSEVVRRCIMEDTAEDILNGKI